MYRSALVGVFLVACSSPSDPVAGDAAADAAIDAPPPACVPFDIMVPSVTSLGRPIWTGSEYLVLVQSRPGVMQRIGADGSIGPTFMLGGDVIGDLLVRGDPIAWTGSELGVVFSLATGSSNSFTLARFAADGTSRGSSTVATGVPNILGAQTLRWADDRYLLGWITMSDATPVATMEEVSADGVAGGVSTVSGYGNNLVGLATNAATYLAAISPYNGGTLTFVAIDRATGTISHHAAPHGVNGTPLVALDHGFVSFAPEAVLPNNSAGPALELIDATGMATTTMPIPNITVSGIVATPYGYHLVATNSDDATGGFIVQDVDLGADGTPLGAVNVRGMISPGVGFTGATVTSRGNGRLTAWAAGPNNAMTARLIQDCVP
jgi:hypothetical protein